MKIYNLDTIQTEAVRLLTVIEPRLLYLLGLEDAAVLLVNLYYFAGSKKAYTHHFGDFGRDVTFIQTKTTLDVILNGSRFRYDAREQLISYDNITDDLQTLISVCELCIEMTE